MPVTLPPSHSHNSLEGHAEHSAHQKQPKQPLPPSTLQRWAGLYHCHHEGVDRVFVDHPLFLGTHGRGNANTYLQGASDLANLDVQYSVLCQAALAAPILLWQQPQGHLHTLQLQALTQTLPQTLSGGIAQYVGLHAASASLAKDSQLTDPASRASSPESARVGSLYAGPTALTGGIAHAVPLTPACPSTKLEDSVIEQHSDMTDCDFTDVVWPASAGSIAYVGNDWPCFPLSQHLRRLKSLPYEGESGLQALTGAPQASNPLACSPANNFETQMARLLKSARVAFCIHNLAYQGKFAQVSCHMLVAPATSLRCCATECEECMMSGLHRLGACGHTVQPSQTEGAVPVYAGLISTPLPSCFCTTFPTVIQ